MLKIIRTTIVVLVAATLVMTAFWRLTLNQQRRAYEEMELLRQEMEQRIAVREAMVDRLSRSRRIAHVRILEQDMGVGGRIESTTLELIELDGGGRELARQVFTVPGDVVTIDAWTVKFDMARVAEGHPLAGHTLLLLRRVYSELIPAVEGQAIDTPGAIPPAYAVGEIGRFEQQVWAHFWDLATDADLARTMGVRVAQGEAVYKPVRTGQLYELVLDAAGGMNLTPLPPETEIAAISGG